MSSSRWNKFWTNLTYILLVVLTVKTVHLVAGQFIDGGMKADGFVWSLVVSGLWLVYTRRRLDYLLRTYWDVWSRMLVVCPAVIGLGLAFAALWPIIFQFSYLLAMALIGGWVSVIDRYRENRENFITVGTGPLPKDIWINPPIEVLKPGHLLLFGGRMARRVREALGHGELVLRDGEGKLVAFSSWMDRGVIIKNLPAIIRRKQQQAEYYVVMETKEPFTDEQNKIAYAFAEETLQRNRDYSAYRIEKRTKLINSLWLPKSWKQFLIKAMPAPGYDWFGLFIGNPDWYRKLTRRGRDSYICIWVADRALDKAGVPLREHGTGLLGLLGLFNPPMPVTYLDEPAMRWLNLEDKATFEQQQK